MIDPDIAEFLAACGKDQTEVLIRGRSPEEKARRRRIGERVKALREELGWSQQDLVARCVGKGRMSADTIAEIEEGLSIRRRGRDRESIYHRIAQRLGTTLEALEAA